ncbi:MAG: ATP phosphoribosyltransferase regulatory subunit [Alphaproteobacteria bacterium]|nr:ATP phosphoribosyltransferase regulatory subunit [Alphaproteobacteria bacterium]
MPAENASLMERALLPAGMLDLLPPEAEQIAALGAALLASFARYGYQRVEPPLVEFESTLLAGQAAGLRDHVFRLMDPVSLRMLAVRADMTLQVARIAATRLEAAPRPLRLSYAGEVLRVRAGQLRTARQFTQAGVELIGSDAPEADVEVASLAAEALAALGVAGLSLDLNSPAIVGATLAAIGRNGIAAAELRAALDHKDTAAVRVLAGDAAAGDLLAGLIAASGLAEVALDRLGRLKLPAEAAREVARLKAVAAGVRAVAPALAITIDAVEYRGLEYQTGVSFSLFARGARGELGRGGRYRTPAGEAATGATLFLDAVALAAPEPTPRRRLFLPQDTAPDVARRLRAEGWDAVQGLDARADANGEGRRLGCTHVLRAGAPTPLNKG